MLAGDADLIFGKMGKILEGFKKAGVYVLPVGPLESFLASSDGDAFDPRAINREQT